MISYHETTRRSNRMIATWTQEAPAVEQYGSITLTQFQQANEVLLTAKQEVQDAEALLNLKRVHLRLAGNDVRAMQREIYLGLISEEGEDSPMLSGMGYIRKSDRKSGLTFKRTTLPDPEGLDPSEN